MVYEFVNLYILESEKQKYIRYEYVKERVRPMHICSDSRLNDDDDEHTFMP